MIKIYADFHKCSKANYPNDELEKSKVSALDMIRERRIF